MTTQAEGFVWTSAPMATDRTPGWRAFREPGDVHQGADGMWFLTSPEAVQSAARRPQIFSSALAYGVLQSPVPLIPLAIDPPDHKKYRTVLDPMLAPRVIDAMAESLRHQARELVETFADRGECDAVADLARLYPTQVFLTLFGMPLEDRDQFILWAETIIEHASPDGSLEPAPELVAASDALVKYLQGYIDQKRSRPADDMLSRVLELSGEDAWSNDEVLGLCFLFTLAGLDTVTAAIGFSLLQLARNPDVRRQMVGDPKLVVPVMEELLRLELPAPMSPRVTTEEAEVCGHVIPAGSTVMLCYAAANRSPEAHPIPDEIDLNAGDHGHLTFGSGIHRCLGSHLARRELRLVLEEFHKLIPDYDVAPGAEPEVVWPAGNLHLTSLPLVFPRR